MINTGTCVELANSWIFLNPPNSALLSIARTQVCLSVAKLALQVCLPKVKEALLSCQICRISSDLSTTDSRQFPNCQLLGNLADPCGCHCATFRWYLTVMPTRRPIVPSVPSRSKKDQSIGRTMVVPCHPDTAWLWWHRIDWHRNRLREVADSSEDFLFFRFHLPGCRDSISPGLSRPGLWDSAVHETRIKEASLALCCIAWFLAR